MEVAALRQQMTQALANDNEIDAREFESIKTGILADKKVEKPEADLLMDELAMGHIERSLIPAVIELVNQVPKPPVTPEKPKSNWSKDLTIQGNFAHVSVTGGWQQYGQETSQTKVEGSVLANVNYDSGKYSWKNKILVEYGNTFTKVVGREISKDNLEFTTEGAHKVMEKDHFKIEVPYMALYTKGPMTQPEGRIYRETTGAKVTYSPAKIGEYSIKVGGGVQQAFDPLTKKWVNDPGVEVIAEVKQKLEFLQEPLANALDVKAEKVAFVNRIEANASVNAFNSLRESVSISNTDTTIRTSLRYYLTDAKSVWIGAGKQWEYGGKIDSTWESKFTTDLGFKFN